MKSFLVLGILMFSPSLGLADTTGLAIVNAAPNGGITWTNGFSNGICTLETASQPTGPWSTLQSTFMTNSTGYIGVALTTNSSFYRLLAVDISTNAAQGYNNLVASYGLLSTVAGNGFGNVDGVNYWQPDFEGGPATNAALSRPHFAMADDAGNLFIVDKCSHSVLKVTTDGNIHTVAGTHFPGDGPNRRAYGTNVALNFPNGLWVRGDGTVYVLDTGNNKVRRLDPDGTVITLFTLGPGFNGGRGLWVSQDESLVYLADGIYVLRWTPSGGIVRFSADAFVDLANLTVDANGNLVVTDHGANRVYRMNQDGSRNPIAGTGYPTKVIDGTPALSSGLFGVRGIWFLPNGGYFLATQEGSQVLYVDPGGRIYVWLNGQPGNTHSGDGHWFYKRGHKISEARSVTVDHQGNVIVVENDAGYVRKIDFRRLSP